MDLQNTGPDEGLICSTPIKRFPSNIVTSTPTCSATGDNDSEEPSNKRRKFFCTESPGWNDSDSDGYDSFEEDSPTKTAAQNSFEITCNELKLINSVVLETELLIKEIDDKVDTEDVNKACIKEKKEILQKELSQLFDKKSVLENSVQSQATFYDVDRVIDIAFLNDTVLSNLNSTLKNVPDEDSNKSNLEKTLINISDERGDSDQFHLSSNDITVKYKEKNEQFKETTLFVNTEQKTSSDAIEKVESLIKQIDKDNVEGVNKACIEELKEFLQKKLSQLIDKKSVLANSAKSQEIDNKVNVEEVNKACIAEIKEYLSSNILVQLFDKESVLKNSVKTILKNLPDEDSEKSNLVKTLINKSDEHDESDQFHLSSNDITVKYKEINDWSNETILFADTLNDTIRPNTAVEPLNKNVVRTNEIQASSSKHGLPTEIICNRNILREITDNTQNKLVLELKLPLIARHEADILPQNNKVYETLKPSDYAIVQEKCQNNNVLKETVQKNDTIPNVTVPLKTSEPTILPRKTDESHENNQFQKNIDFDNSIIIIGKHVIHKLDNIKSESELHTKIHNNKYKDNKRVNRLCNFYEKLQSICAAISSLQGKHNSSNNINVTSKHALSKCEILINKIRNENNMLLEETREDDDAIKAMIGIIKQNAQYVYEVIHAIVHKTDLKTVRAPFISDNNKENDDNYDPKWDALRQLETDEERYKAVRKRWLNLGIPDPHSNLTYRSRRYPKNNNINFKPLGNEARTEDYERFFEIKAKNMQDNYNFALSALDRKETADVEQLFKTHKQNQDDLLRNCNSYTYAQRFRNMYSDQMQETRLLKADYGYQRRALFIDLQSKQDSLRSQKNEAYTFLKFYDGLNGQKSLKMSKAELQEALEIDDMISKYEDFYKR